MFSRDLLDPDSKRGSEFFYHTGKVMEFAGKPNVADFFPLLRFLDPQGIRRKTQFHVEKAFEIAGEFISERTEVREREKGDEKTKDYLDVLLEFRGGDGVDEEPSSFSSRDINVIVFVSLLFSIDMKILFEFMNYTKKYCFFWLCSPNISQRFKKQYCFLAL